MLIKKPFILTPFMMFIHKTIAQNHPTQMNE